MYKIILCDEDKMFMHKLKSVIKQEGECPASAIFYMYSNAERFLWNYKGDADLIFMDVRMTHMNGNEAARRLRVRDQFAMLVFCTLELPSTECFKVQPFRYISKNLSVNIFREEIKECLLEMKRRHRRHYVVLTKDGIAYRVPVDCIVYLALMKRGCEVYIDSGEHAQKHEKIATRRKMDDIYDEVREFGFISIHKSYVVNMDYIVQVKGDHIILKGGTELNVTRSKRGDFHKRFTEHLGYHYRRERKEKHTYM